MADNVSIMEKTDDISHDLEEDWSHLAQIVDSDKFLDTEESSKRADEKVEEKIESKYLLFEWEELDKWATHYREKLDLLKTVKHIPYEIDKWEKEQIKEMSTQTMLEQIRETQNTRWKVFPSLIEEFIFGVFGLENFLEDPNVSEIFLDGESKITVIYRDGTRRAAPKIAKTKEHFISICRKWVDIFGDNNQRFDKSSPFANVTLPNGDRMHIIGYIGDQPAHVSIRRHDFSITSFQAIVENGTVHPKIKRLLSAAVKGKVNIILAGSTGSGKTTLLRCMMTEIPPEERVIVVEDTKEIGYLRAHPERWGVELQSRTANTEGEGQFTMEQIMIETLRMSPSRVVVGEVRGPEVIPMLLSMSQGNEGSLSTIHANSAKDVITRLSNLAAITSGNASMGEQAVLGTIAQAVEMIVFMRRDGKDKPPRLAEVIMIDGTQLIETGAPAYTNIVRWNSKKQEPEIDTNGEFPRLVQTKMQRGGWAGWDYSDDVNVENVLVV